MAENLSQISTELKVIIQAVTQNGVAAFAEVVEYPKNSFTGSPAVTILPDDVSSAIATVNQNRRSYMFIVEIFYSMENKTSAVAYADMRILVDAVLDAIERTIDLNGKADILSPVPMRFVTENIGGGVYLIAPIRILAQKDVVLF